jgi:hypothetical protein
VTGERDAAATEARASFSATTNEFVSNAARAASKLLFATAFNVTLSLA